ncbi:2-amino-4-hydroxy-6-hydroxymethyldihydropteridine diphosphokinase [Mobiluncus mulieris]|uniref:Bifunctional folate synthesis protein n=1 Tax=Mobiluncus mulieris TaxID=2052 RepID=A0A7Y0Y456_9ACTO|nr:2-amino-4-hydroxy-6-hydroxymethyldihydropteridine diphosphokinase [Mobiluncus mulieris]
MFQGFRRLSVTKQQHQAHPLTGDCITLRGIHTLAIHGVLDFEHHQPQDFLVDVSLWFDSRPAARVDDLALTVDYSEVATKVQAVLGGKSRALIERLADNIAMRILEDEQILAVDVTVHKPHAPLDVEFQDVSICIHRTREDFENEATLLPADLTVRPDKPRVAVLALGANLGDPVRTLREVVADLQSVPEFLEVQVSPLARTRPVLAKNQAPQPDYYNAVVRVVSRLSAAELLDLAQHLEQNHHRKRPSRWAARTLDIDIIAVEGLESDHPSLTLPHPRAASRAFVLVPWLELDATARLEGQPVAELAAAQDREGIVNLWLDWLDTSRADSREPHPEEPGKTAVAPASPEAATETASVLGTPAGTLPSEAADFGLPSWRAALGTPAAQRVVDDVAGDIYSPPGSIQETGASAPAPHEPGTAPSTPVTPDWQRVRKHEAR